MMQMAKRTPSPPPLFLNFHILEGFFLWTFCESSELFGLNGFFSELFSELSSLKGLFLNIFEDFLNMCPFKRLLWTLCSELSKLFGLKSILPQPFLNFFIPKSFLSDFFDLSEALHFPRICFPPWKWCCFLTKAFLVDVFSQLCELCISRKYH